MMMKQKRFSQPFSLAATLGVGLLSASVIASALQLPLYTNEVDAMLSTSSNVEMPEPLVGHEQQGRFIVLFHQQAQHRAQSTESLPFDTLFAEDAVQQAGGAVIATLPSVYGMSVQLTPSARAALASNPNVRLIEPDPIRHMVSPPVHKSAVPLEHTSTAANSINIESDFPTDQVIPYALRISGADQVSDAQSSHQTVCVVDTGYDIAHPDLMRGANVTGVVSNTLTESVDLSTWDSDSYGQGTHVAGTISALDNDIGVMGALRNGELNLHIVKVIHSPGYWTIWGSDLIAGLAECERVNATIANFSLAGTQASVAEAEAMQRAYDNGMLLVGASGNRGNEVKFYPAAYPSVISVGAVDESLQPWAYTQENAEIEFVAGGLEAYSTIPGGLYRHRDGTAFSAAAVTGMAALVWSQNTHCSNQQIRDLLQLTAQDLGDTGRDHTFGFGLLDAKRAADTLNNNGCDLRGAIGRVDDAADYELLYRHDIAERSRFDTTPVPYSIDNSHKQYPNGLARVAYYLELDDGHDTQWVWVSFDAISSELAKLGVPSRASDAQFQQALTNLVVASNVEGVSTGNHASGGIIEFWPGFYGSSKGLPTLGGSSIAFDENDKPHSQGLGDYGSMQIHLASAGQTLFAYNHFGAFCDNAPFIDIGIGNNGQENHVDKAVHKDWTFAFNGNQYVARTLEVLVQPEL